MATHSSVLAWEIPWSWAGYSPWGCKEWYLIEVTKHAVLYNYHHSFNFRTYSLLQKKNHKTQTAAHQHSLSIPYFTQMLATNSLLFVPVDVSILDISYNQNSKICFLLGPVLFSQYSVFKVYPFRAMNQYFIPFYG